MTDRPLSLRNVVIEERQLIEDIQSRSSELLEVLDDFSNVYDEIEKENAVFTRAFNFTYELVEDRALDFLLIEAKKAIIATEEFNYPLFINKLLQAIILSYNTKAGLISIVVDADAQRVLDIVIDMSLLGSIETYAEAVEFARKELNVGKIPDPEVRSRVWREKIYGTAREGVRVLKRYNCKERG
jgi:hypothetical protein